MPQRSSEVTIGHGQSIVQSPQGTDESVGDSWETTTGCGVRLEHHELLAGLLGDTTSVQVLLAEVDGSGMGEEHGKNVLGLTDWCASVEDRGAVISWISETSVNRCDEVSGT